MLMMLAMLVTADVAYGYIDPGTTQSLAMVLAPLIAVAAGFFGYLLWPVRKALGGMFGKSDQAPPDEADSTAEESDQE